MGGINPTQRFILTDGQSGRGIQGLFLGCVFSLARCNKKDYFLITLSLRLKIKNNNQISMWSFLKNLKQSNKEIIQPFEKAPLFKGNKFFSIRAQLAFDIYQTSDEFIIQSAIAGVTFENLTISIKDNVLKITGFRANPVKLVEEENVFKEENEESVYAKEKLKQLVKECHWGSFGREIILPEEINPLHSKALLKNGILLIRLIKLQKHKKREVPVSTLKDLSST